MKKTDKTGRAPASSLNRLIKWAALTMLVLFSANHAIAQWTFTTVSGTHGTLSDGTWTFNAYAYGSDLVVSNCVASPAMPSPLDLSTSINGGDYNITKLGLRTSLFQFFPPAPFMGSHTNNVSSLVLPNTVTNIGLQVFKGCYNLKGNLVIPDSVEKIGLESFYGCAFDGTLTLGNSVRDIGASAFSGSSFTGSLALPGSLELVGLAFVSCKFESVSSWGTLDIIPPLAFYGASFSTNLFVIPDQIQSIQIGAFAGCHFGESVIVGDGVTEIDELAFALASMKRISLPSTDVSIRVGAFNTRLLLTILADSETEENELTDILAGLMLQSQYQPLQAVYYRGEYPDSIWGLSDLGSDLFGAGLESLDVNDPLYSLVMAFYDPFYPLVSFVKTANVASWNAYSDLGDIEGGVDFWEGQRIVCGDWDWDGYPYPPNFLDPIPPLVEPDYEWYFVGDAISGVITNAQGWKFDVEVWDDELWVTNCAAAPLKYSKLDFSTPINAGAYSIVEMGYGYWENSPEECALFLNTTWSQRVISLVLPDTVLYINDGAFIGLVNCTGSLALPDSLEWVGLAAFALSTFESVSSWGSLDTAFYGMFAYVTFTTNVFVVPNQITYIEESAFTECNFGEMVVVNDGTIEIGNYAFENISFRDTFYYETADQHISAVSLPSTGVTFGDSIFGDLTSSAPIGVFFRGEYPDYVGENDYYGSAFDLDFWKCYIVVKSEFVDSWNDYSLHNDIRTFDDPVDIWLVRAIYQADWDFDKPYLGDPPEGDTEMWVIVNAINVSTDCDVTLTWEWTPVTARLGASYTYEVYISTDLTANNWTLCPSTSLARGGAYDGMLMYDGSMPVSTQRFFKVKAIKD